MTEIFPFQIQPSERTDFERALRDAKSELATLRCNIESTERERRRQQQHSYAADKEKLQKLYGKYLRAESFRKALVYQKRYLLLLLGTCSADHDLFHSVLKPP